MDICNPSETPALARFSRIAEMIWFQPIIGRFYKMRVSWEFNIYNLFKSFINTVLSFSKYDVNIICIDSKYNVRRCDVLVQNKTIHSLNLFALDRIFLCMATWAIGKTFHVIRGRVVCINVFISVSIWVWPPCVLLMIASNIRNVFT